MSGLSRKAMAEIILINLGNLKEHGPKIPTIGICANVEGELWVFEGADDTRMFWSREIKEAFIAWEDVMATGCEVFPISGEYCGAPEYMWGFGEYASARWRLVDHLITHFTSIAGEAE